MDDRFVPFDSEGIPVFDCDAETKAQAIAHLHDATGKTWSELFAEGYRILKVNCRKGETKDTGYE